MNELKTLLENMDLEFFAKGQHKIDPEALFAQEDGVFLDVRSKEECESLALPLQYQSEYVHIPTNEIPNRLSELSKEKTTGIFCSGGVRAAIVYSYLQANGYQNVRIIVGGYEPLIAQLKPGKVWKSVKKNG